jgi:hypothetical protein
MLKEHIDHISNRPYIQSAMKMVLKWRDETIVPLWWVAHCTRVLQFLEKNGVCHSGALLVP